MIQLANKYSTDYCIIVDDDAIPSERYAAEECAHFLTEITGAYFPVYTSFYGKSCKKNIVIGYGVEAEKRGVVPDSELGSEGYEIKVVGNDIVIAGGQPRGTLYGVYAFLEEDLGCRWFTPSVSYIPRKTALVIHHIDRIIKPALEYREVFYGAAFDGDWNARNRLNGSNDQLYIKHGGRMSYNRQLVHTFDNFVSADEYFEDHPEYFSLIDGKRLKQETQLCLTNPDVLAIVKKKAREWTVSNPEATILSISQNDFYNPCQCENCSKIDAYEGSHAGTMIWFVNQIAEELEKDYPDLIIDTLAYQYTRPAPKHIKPRPNVCVRLCSIECCFGHPLDQCDEIDPRYKDLITPGASFQRDLKDWAKICDRVYIWDYVTNFRHYCMPFPNLDVLQPNIRFFIENSVKGVFEQGNYSQGGGPDFNELRTWMLAKLLWNPECDIEKVRAEFMHAYFGKAAPALDHYLKLVHKKVREENIHSGIYNTPDAIYITDDILTKANDLFDEAEKLADNDEVLWRVQRARMSIRYMPMARHITHEETDLAEVDDFMVSMDQFNLTRISEWLSKDEERARIVENMNKKNMK